MKQDQPISDLEVERMLLDELPEERTRLIRESLEANQDSRIDQFRASNQEILQAYLPGEIAQEIQRRLHPSGSRSEAESGKVWKRFFWTGLPMVASAAALIIWLRVEPSEQEQSKDHYAFNGEMGRANAIADQVRIKGLRPYLRVYRQKGSVTEKLDNRSLAASGDLLQLSYVAAGHRQGIVFSLDGAGVVTLHYPSDPSQSTQLQDGGEVPLSHAYELDAAPSFERFFLVTTQDNRSVDVELVLSAARELGRDLIRAEQQDLALPAHYFQFSIVLRKGSS